MSLNGIHFWAKTTPNGQLGISVRDHCRCVGTQETEGDGEHFAHKMKRHLAKLEEQFAESAKLENATRENLKGLGYGL